MPQYRIKPGGSFKLPDGTVKTTGDKVELDSDVAATHAAVLDLLPADDAPQTHAAPAATE